MFGEGDLSDYYTTHFRLMYFHKYTLTEIESMYPFERLIFISLIANQLEKEKEDMRRVNG